jgi:hypothetical protein
MQNANTNVQFIRSWRRYYQDMPKENLVELILQMQHGAVYRQSVIDEGQLAAEFTKKLAESQQNYHQNHIVAPFPKDA